MNSSLTLKISRWLGRTVTLICPVLIGSIIIPVAHGETGVWKTKTAQLPVFFPTPTADTGSPKLLVIPLLGPQLLLLPGGKLPIWVGRSDGTPVANATVTVTVPTPGNPLANGQTRVTSITVPTDENGLAQVSLTTPAPDNGGGSGGGDDGGAAG